MAEPVVGIAMLGDKELERKLARLATPASQKRSIRPSLKKSAKRLKLRLIENLSGKIVTPRTGRWLRATQAAKVKAIKRARHRIGSGFSTPTREELGIPADTPGRRRGYYPYAVEYGTPTAPAFAPMRRAVNDNTLEEFRLIGTDVGKGITKEAMKSA